MQENIKAEEETPAGLDALFEEDEFEALPERKKRKKPSGNFFRSRKFRKNLFVICMLAYPVFQFAVMWAFVNFDSILMTFQKYDTLEGWKFVGLDNYAN